MIRPKQYCQQQHLKPHCQICGKDMKNAYDTYLKKINPYLWQTTCKHDKDLRLSIG